MQLEDIEEASEESGGFDDPDEYSLLCSVEWSCVWFCVEFQRLLDALRKLADSNQSDPDYQILARICFAFRLFWLKILKTPKSNTFGLIFLV